MDLNLSIYPFTEYSGATSIQVPWVMTQLPTDLGITFSTQEILSIQVFSETLAQWKIKHKHCLQTLLLSVQTRKH